MYFAFTSPDMPYEVRQELYRNLWFLADVHPSMAAFAAGLNTIVEDDDEEEENE